MDQHRQNVLDTDLRESRPSNRSFEVLAKSIYYLLERPLADIFLSTKIKKLAGSDPTVKMVDRFLWREGGMFKTYAYEISDSKRPIKNSMVLVQGCGYGHCIFQIAKFKPKKIIAFDLYAFEEEWKFVAEKCNEVFGVEVEFIKGDVDSVPGILRGSFDHLVSDAVLEHVRNMDEFSRSSYELLKTDGIFYASFGPLWYGPGGDHVNWGANNRYDQILLPPEEYAKKKEEFLRKHEAVADSCDPYYLIKDDIFSRLTCLQYLDSLSNAGLKKVGMWAKISPESITFLENNPAISKELDNKNYPKFDRYCLGASLWMKK